MVCWEVIEVADGVNEEEDTEAVEVANVAAEEVVRVEVAGDDDGAPVVEVVRVEVPKADEDDGAVIAEVTVDEEVVNVGVKDELVDD